MGDDTGQGTAGQSRRRTGQATRPDDVGGPEVPALIRLVACDAHPLVLRGIKSLFESENGFEVVGETTSARDVPALVQSLGADVALVDFDLPHGAALELAADLRSAQSPVRLVFFASAISEDQFLKARQLGVRGVVLKSMPPHLLVQCVRTVHAGGEFVERDTLLRAFSKLERRTSGNPLRSDATLTAREREIMQLVIDGLGNKAIADRLGCGAGTVKAHLQRIYDKLGVHSRFALMRTPEGNDSAK